MWIIRYDEFEDFKKKYKIYYDDDDEQHFNEPKKDVLYRKVNNNYYQLKYLKSKKIKIDQKSFILFRKNLPDNIYYHELFINESNKTLNIILSLN